MKAYEGSRGMAPLIHNCGARWIEWSASRAGRFASVEEPPNPLHRRLGGPRAGLDVSEKSVFRLLGLKPRPSDRSVPADIPDSVLAHTSVGLMQ